MNKIDFEIDLEEHKVILTDYTIKEAGYKYYPVSFDNNYYLFCYLADYFNLSAEYELKENKNQ